MDPLDTASAADLVAEVRRLRGELAAARTQLALEVAARARSRKRLQRKAARERESLEAHLSKLVSEMGQLRHLAERCHRLEAEARRQAAENATREAALRAEIDRLTRAAGGLAPVAAMAARAAGSPSRRGRAAEPDPAG